MAKQKFRLEEIEGDSSREARVSDFSDLFNRSEGSCDPYCTCNKECNCDIIKCDHCYCYNDCGCDKDCGCVGDNCLADCKVEIWR